MSSASLPISTSESTPAAAANSNNQSHSFITNPSIRSFLTRLSNSLRHALVNRRPWTELIDRTAFSRPESVSDAASRVRKNFSYFRVNYLTLLALLLAFSLLSHPFSLFLLASLVAAWLFLYTFRPSEQPLLIGGRSFSDRETLAILCVVTVIVVFLTSVGSLLMSTVTMGLLVLCAHGAVRDPEDLFLDEQEPLGSGLFSFIGGAASSAAVNAAVAHV